MGVLMFYVQYRDSGVGGGWRESLKGVGVLIYVLCLYYCFVFLSVQQC